MKSLSFVANSAVKTISSVDFDKRYSTYPTPTYLSDSVSVAENLIRYD